MLTVHTLNDRICAHSNNAAHGTEIPPNARILFCNRQVGARLDGTVPEEPLEQTEVIFERIRIILAASNMTSEDIIKFTAKVPSAPSLRQRFDEHAEAMIPHVDNAAIAFIGSVGAPVTPILVKYGSSLRPVKRQYAPLDIDVFPMDNSGTKKEGVGYTYKGFDGYAPLAAYLGEEGWCLACELRPGSQHGQKEFIHFLERVVPRARELTHHRLLCRLDSGHDAAENRAWLAREGVDFIIKWNPHKQDLEAWLERAEQEAEWSFPRPGKRVGTFSEAVEETFGGEPRQHRRVIRVTERTIDKHGARLLVPDITIEGWWTSLGECVCADAKVIALYCDHAAPGARYSHYRASVPRLFLKKGRNVPDQFQLHRLAVVGWRDNDAVDELPHQLDGLPRGFVALRKGSVDIGHPLLVALRRLRMQGENLVRVA